MGNTYDRGQTTKVTGQEHSKRIFLYIFLRRAGLGLGLTLDRSFRMCVHFESLCGIRRLVIIRPQTALSRLDRRREIHYNLYIYHYPDLNLSNKT